MIGASDGNGMHCTCGANTHVTDSRPHKFGIRRTRACIRGCGAPSFATLECVARRDTAKRRVRGATLEPIAERITTERMEWVKAAMALLGRALS